MRTVSRESSCICIPMLCSKKHFLVPMVFSSCHLLFVMFMLGPLALFPSQRLYIVRVIQILTNRPHSQTYFPFLDADIVCSRAKNHYDPEQNIYLSDTASQLDNPVTTLENFKNLFKRTHVNMADKMYFS